MVGKHPFHMVGEKYIAAVRDGGGAVPLLIPVLANPIPPEELIASVDGFFVHRLALQCCAEAL